MTVLVHLCTPAGWRAALDDGALRPEGPFVHLSWPEQVQLPAQRLFPGRRDLGIKDMGNLLPGHGGIMDRLDSLLPSAVAAYLLLSWVAPPV